MKPARRKPNMGTRPSQASPPMRSKQHSQKQSSNSVPCGKRRMQPAESTQRRPKLEMGGDVGGRVLTSAGAVDEIAMLQLMVRHATAADQKTCICTPQREQRKEIARKLQPS
jgi:hypothetical protein